MSEVFKGEAPVGSLSKWMKTSRSYDDIVTFGRAMFETQWQYSDNPGDHIFDYFEAPHKWSAEEAKWRELGGTLEKDCLVAFESWYDHRNDPEPEEKS